MDPAAACFAQSGVDISVLRSTLAEGSLESLDDLGERDLLLFDEVVPLSIILRVPLETTPDVVDELAQRISLTVEVSSSNNSSKKSDLAAPPLIRRDSNNRQARGEPGNLIISKTLGPSDLPSISVHRGQPVVVWTSEVTIPYIKSKVSLNKIIFSTSLTLNESNYSKALQDDEDAYMEDITPADRDKNYNLLKALSADLELASDPPRLVAARVSIMPPLVETSTRKPRKSARRTMPIATPIAVRIRSFQVPHSERVILSVDMETSSGTKEGIKVEAISLQLANGKARAISSATFPIGLDEHASYTYSFDLLPSAEAQAALNIPVTLIIQLRSKTPGVEDYGSLITSKWKTTVSLAKKTSAADMTRSTSQTQHKGQLQKASAAQMTRSSSNMSMNSEVRPNGSNPLSGIKITIHCPETVLLGHVVEVDVTLQNNSKTIKDLALEVSRSSGNNHHRRTGLPQNPNLASRSVLTTAELRDMHNYHTQETMDLICLTNSTKIAPLQPGSRTDLRMRYLAMAPGIVTLQDVRLIDLATGKYIEVKHLQTLVVLPPHPSA